jgi:hypothetical protein
MEYEIEDDALLFDHSTNPSLEHHHRRAAAKPSPGKPLDDPSVKRRLQKAEVIPEEEPA